MAQESPFEGLTIERADALPKRLVAGRESIPNPFTDAVRDSYAEAKSAGQDKAVRAIYVPVDRSKVTVRTVTRKNKDGKEEATQWEQHPNITTALYLLRQAAIKNDIGVRIVVDYDAQELPKVTAKMKQHDKDGNVLKNADGSDKEVERTFNNVTLHKFKAQTTGAHRGKVRVRFLGQEKKKVTKKDKGQSPEEQTAA